MTEELLIHEEEKATEPEARPEATTEDEVVAEQRFVPLEEAIEAVLFAAGHPISYATLARVFQLTPGKVKERVLAYSLRYNDPGFPRGVILLCYDDACQLCTKESYLPEIREVLGIKKSGTLSTSSMEALAIIAYNQPVTRFFVDSLRRADSSYAMTNLLDRGLIECKGRLDAPGRPMLYGTTDDFLRCFGLPSIGALPKTTEDLMDMFLKARENEKASRDNEQTEGQISMDDPELAVDSGAADASSTEEEKQQPEEISLEDEPSAEDDPQNF